MRTGVLEITAWLATSRGSVLTPLDLLLSAKIWAPNYEITEGLDPSGIMVSLQEPSQAGQLHPRAGTQTAPWGCHTPRQVDRQLIQLLSVGLSSLHQVHFAAGWGEGLHLLQ